MWPLLGPVLPDGVPPLVRVHEYPSGAVSIQAQVSTSKPQLSCTMSGRRGGHGGVSGGDGGGRGGSSGHSRLVHTQI